MFISVIINDRHWNNWKLLFEYANIEMSFSEYETSVFQRDVKGAIRSINRRMNRR